MVLNFYHQTDHRTLLIFLAGWGTTPQVVHHYAIPDGWDYLTLHDYTDLLSHCSEDTFAELSSHRYDRVYLVAWSMGVWAAEVLSHLFPHPTIAVAVAGTPIPMDDSYGIPEHIFRGTLEGLTDDNRARFDRRMCGGKKLLSVYQSFAARSTEDLREELLYVFDHSKATRDNAFTWTRAIIGEKDLIIPPANQVKYWTEHSTPIEILEGVGHYPFLEYQSWTDLLHI